MPPMIILFLLNVGFHIYISLKENKYFRQLLKQINSQGNDKRYHHFNGNWISSTDPVIISGLKA